MDLDTIRAEFEHKKAELRISRRCLNGYHGAICVPAANLNRGSRFSGSLSGVEPWLPVTRRCLG